MIRLNVLNMKEFLKTVNGCVGAVNVLYADGGKENINGENDVQCKLQSIFDENKDYLKISLDIPNPKDYMSIVCFSIGDC